MKITSLLCLGVSILLFLGCEDGRDCRDCGPCGIFGGPLLSDELHVYRVGVDPDGVAAVGVDLLGEGTCNESIDVRWLYWDEVDGAVRIEPPSMGPDELDHLSITYDGDTFIWSDRDLVVEIFESGLLTLEAHFRSSASTRIVECSGTAGSVSCVQMP